MARTCFLWVTGRRETRKLDTSRIDLRRFGQAALVVAIMASKTGRENQ